MRVARDAYEASEEAQAAHELEARRQAQLAQRKREARAAAEREARVAAEEAEREERAAERAEREERAAAEEAEWEARVAAEEEAEREAVQRELAVAQQKDDARRREARRAAEEEAEKEAGQRESEVVAQQKDDARRREARRAAKREVDGATQPGQQPVLQAPQAPQAATHIAHAAAHPPPRGLGSVGDSVGGSLGVWDDAIDEAQTVAEACGCTLAAARRALKACGDVDDAISMILEVLGGRESMVERGVERSKGSIEERRGGRREEGGERRPWQQTDSLPPVPAADPSRKANTSSEGTVCFERGQAGEAAPPPKPPSLVRSRGFVNAASKKRAASPRPLDGGGHAAKSPRSLAVPAAEVDEDYEHRSAQAHPTHVRAPSPSPRAAMRPPPHAAPPRAASPRAEGGSRVAPARRPASTPGLESRPPRSTTPAHGDGNRHRFGSEGGSQGGSEGGSEGDSGGGSTGGGGEGAGFCSEWYEKGRSQPLPEGAPEPPSPVTPHAVSEPSSLRPTNADHVEAMYVYPPSVGTDWQPYDASPQHANVPSVRSARKAHSVVYMRM